MKVRSMFSAIAHRYDIANSVLSFGMHRWWRKVFINALPLENNVVMDLCTGTGDLLHPLSKRSKFLLGVDFTISMLIAGQGKFNAHIVPAGHLLSIINGDGLILPFRNDTFDLITVAFGVRNFEDLQMGLKSIKRVLKSGGRLAILEFGQPSGLFGLLFRFYSKFLMPLIGGLITGNKEAYQYLPKTSATFPSGERFVQAVKSEGFTPEQVIPLLSGLAWVYILKLDPKLD